MPSPASAPAHETYRAWGRPPAAPASAPRSPSRGHWTRRCPASPSPVEGRASKAAGTMLPAVPVLGRAPYLVPRNGEGALAARGEVAVHPAQALLLVPRVEQVAQTGREHTGRRGPGAGAGQVLRSPARSPPCTPGSVWVATDTEQASGREAQCWDPLVQGPLPAQPTANTGVPASTQIHS